jgi:hypothetical protein
VFGSCFSITTDFLNFSKFYFKFNENWWTTYNVRGNLLTGKGKGKFHPRTGHEVPDGVLALGGVRWSTPRPGRFTPGKDPVPIV